MLVKILIPLYRKELPPEEERSFKQCLKVLHQYPVVIITYLTLNIDEYIKIAKAHNVNLEFEYFDEEYFKSVTAYSRLLLNKKFYARFQNTEYILIYQLDAFVFRDELQEWCGKGYDYVGSPWFTHYKTYEEGYRLYKVGNGGVSLRKISSFLEKFRQPLPMSIYPFYVKNIRKKGFFRMCIKTLHLFFLLLFTKRNVEYYLENMTDERINEDCFWADGLSDTRLALQVPDIRTAARFCFEKSPSYLYKLTGSKLPFACHAYEKYEYDGFWKKYIV